MILKFVFVRFYLVTVSFIGFSLSLKAQIKVKDLTVEYFSNPVGIDITEPRLSWKIESKERDFRQSAYQILVATSENKLNEKNADVWNEGKIISSSSILNSLKGKALLSGKRYFWKLKVWDQNNRATEFSETAFWEMGLLKNADWQAKWISAPKVFKWQDFSAQRQKIIKDPALDDIATPAPQFRKSFLLNKRTKQARLYISGVGYNVPYLNGERVGDHVLDPAFTRYDKTVFYSTYEVTKQIQSGENVLGVVLGNGWYNMFDKAVWGFDHAPWRADAAVKAQLEIVFEDGSKQIISSDETWKVSPGPIVFNSIRLGEYYDATKETKGWNTIGFDDKQWYEPLLVSGPLGKLKAQMIEPIRIRERIKPVSIGSPAPGVYIFNLGRNIAGFAELKINAPKGTAITLRYGEVLYENGNLNQEKISRYSVNKNFQTDKYICKGEGLETWHPEFVYHGFQYIEVTGLATKPDLESITGLIVNTDLESVGNFSCSNEMFNKIQQSTLNSYLGNFHGYPTDCPQREKNGWTGDAHLAAEVGLYNFKAQNAYSKWLKDFSDEQRPSGEVPAIIPTSGWGYAWGNGPAWDNAMVLIPWYLYQYSGDQRILEQMYPNIKKYVDYLTTKANNHILSIGLGDWVPVKTTTPIEVTSTAYYYVDAFLISKMATLLGKKEDAAKYQELSKKIKQAFNDKFYKGNGMYDKGSQTALSTVLYQGLATDENLTTNALASAVKAADDHLDCGILGTKYLLHALADNGKPDLAYKIINQRTYPGWGYWMEQGATTLWENWDGSDSRNHIMFGDVSAWFYKNLGGISPDDAQPGFKQINFKPYFAPDLNWAKSSHQSMYGEIISDWRREGNSIIYTINIPSNTTGLISLPKNENMSIDGKPLAKLALVGSLQEDNGLSKFRLGSGTYQIILNY